MTKTRQPNLAITATDSNTLSHDNFKQVRGSDSQIWLPRFCHINSLEDKISNTAATIQPNPFWFWEKYHFFFMFCPENG